MSKVVYAYISREQLEAMQMEPTPYGNRNFLCSTVNGGKHVRVAIMEVEGSIADKAWAEMTEDERNVLCPQWEGERVADVEQVARVAKHLAITAECAAGAAAKLLAAVEATNGGDVF